MPDSTTKRVYRGWLVRAAWSDGDGVYLASAKNGHPDDDPLAIQIEEAMDELGSYLTVTYWTAPEELSTSGLTDDVILAGLGEPKVGHAYSEYTGYLWTDEEINVDGHDLIGELGNHLGVFLHLEIAYSREAE